MPSLDAIFDDFLQQQDWQVARDQDGRRRWAQRGEHGEWGCAAVVEDERLTVYSIFLGTIPPGREAACAEFCALANFGLPWACFELGGEPLQLRCRTGLDAVGGARIDPTLVRNLVMHGVSAFDRYLPALRAVLGGLGPAEAVDRVELTDPA